jgi:thiosulfate/3-mercaptopyruvate sulfurtransferase
MPLLPPLVSPSELRAALGDGRVRVFDATVFPRRAAEGGPYTVESGRESYARAHIPGAGFADIPGALSDPASPFSFTLPVAEHFAAAIGALGIGDDTHVVVSAQDTPMWATRLWWLLRYFGHDDTSVLDGGLVAWTAAGGPVEPGETRRRTASGHPPNSPPPWPAAVSAATSRSSPTAAAASPRRSTCSRSG